MIDFINLIVGCISTFILGLVFHSSYLHAKEKYGWKFPWDHDEFIYNCRTCGYKTDSHSQFSFHNCYLDKGKEGWSRREN